MRIVFLNQVVKIKTCKKSRATFYYVEKRWIWKGWFKFKKELVIVHKCIGEKIYSIESFSDSKRYYDSELKQVFYKPHLDLYLSNGSCESYFFENENSLHARLHEITKNNPHITIF